jgi:hypothetical protein
MPTLDDKKRGLYGKYKVERLDGSSVPPNGKHAFCEYFVLDLEHDKHAKAAIRAYAESCAKEFPDLAKDLRKMLRPPHRCGCRSAGHEGGCVVLYAPPSFGS